MLIRYDGLTGPCHRGNHYVCWSSAGEWATCSCPCHQPRRRDA